MSNLGIVTIGRNEGDRLRRCLDSLVGRGLPVVYVDSNSTDGSVELARSLGVSVVELDLSRPFTAARARNEGFRTAPADRPGGRIRPDRGWRLRGGTPAGSTVPVRCSRRGPTSPWSSDGVASDSPIRRSTTAWQTWSGTCRSERSRPAAATPCSSWRPYAASADTTRRSSPPRTTSSASGSGEKVGKSSASTPR